jgi:hypothetical protein
MATEATCTDGEGRLARLQVPLVPTHIFMYLLDVAGPATHGRAQVTFYQCYCP